MRSRERNREPLLWLIWVGVGLALLWGALVIQAGGSIALAAATLAGALLKGVTMLAPSVLSGWFLLALFAAPGLLRLAGRLLPRASSLEVGQVKLHFAPLDLAELALGGPPRIPPGEEFWTIPGLEMAGSDGPILEEPPADPGYQYGMAQLPLLFRDLSAENMSAKGQALIDLEQGWVGEYAPELAASILHLRTYARRNMARLTGYLSITLLFRHLMLFFHGRQQHAAQLVQDLELLEPHHREGFLRRPAMLWVLLALCQRGEWADAQRLCNWLPAGETEERAALAYLRLLQGKPAEAAVLAELALADTPPLTSFTALLALTQGRALLALERPLEALAPTRWVLTAPLLGDGGLAEPLRTAARQVIARAATLLGWPEPLYALYQSDAQAGQDPVVLHALALLAARAGQREQARQFIRRAEALLPAGKSELSRAIKETAGWLGRF